VDLCEIRKFYTPLAPLKGGIELKDSLRGGEFNGRIPSRGEFKRSSPLKRGINRNSPSRRGE